MSLHKLWHSLEEWLGVHDIDPRDWQALHIVKDWWVDMIHKRGPYRKALGDWEGKKGPFVQEPFNYINYDCGKDKKGGGFVVSCRG